MFLFTCKYSTRLSQSNVSVKPFSSLSIVWYNDFTFAISESNMIIEAKFENKIFKLFIVGSTALQYTRA